MAWWSQLSSDRFASEAGRAVGVVGFREVAEAGESSDVGVGPVGQDEADRRDEGRGEAAASQHDLDERSPGPAVAVGEGVDRRELGVGERGRDEG